MVLFLCLCQNIECIYNNKILKKEFVFSYFLRYLLVQGQRIYSLLLHEEYVSPFTKYPAFFFTLNWWGSSDIFTLREFPTWWIIKDYKMRTWMPGLYPWGLKAQLYQPVSVSLRYYGFGDVYSIGPSITKLSATACKHFLRVIL